VHTLGDEVLHFRFEAAQSIKYEEVYLRAYDSVAQAKKGIARYIDFYNVRRPHSSLDKRTPDEFYFATLPAMKEAA
jgi:putative transposase